MLLNRVPAKIETYNDLDGEVVNFFRVLREDSEGLIRAIALTPFSREEFYIAITDHHDALTPRERARRFYVRARQARTGLAQTATLGRWANCKNTSRAGMSGVVSRWFGGIGALSEIAERLRMLRQHGMRRRYYHDEVGWNARMDGFQGAVLRVKLKHIREWNRKRRAAAERYDSLFRRAGVAEKGLYPGGGIVLPREAEGSTHAWHQYVVRCARRDALREFLTGRGIGTEIYYPAPLHMQEALKGLGYKKGDFPEAERAARWADQMIFEGFRP